MSNHRVKLPAGPWACKRQLSHFSTPKAVSSDPALVLAETLCLNKLPVSASSSAFRAATYGSLQIRQQTILFLSMTAPPRELARGSLAVRVEWYTVDHRIAGGEQRWVSSCCSAVSGRRAGPCGSVAELPV